MMIRLAYLINTQMSARADNDRPINLFSQPE
jgi:hypothetical protein